MGKKAEQFESISDFKKFVLDIAVRQINQSTDLNVSYNLFKKGRSFTSIRFYVNRQVPEQLPFPLISLLTMYVTRTHDQILEDLGIKDVKIIQQILSDKALTDGLFKFSYDLKTGRTKADKNPAGLLLKVLGIR